LQDLQVRTPEASTLSTSLTVRTMVAEKILCTWVMNTTVLSEGALVITNEAYRPMVSALKDISINMARLL